MKYRPSKPFVIAMLILCPMVIGSGYVLRASQTPTPREMMSGSRTRQVVMKDQPPEPSPNWVGRGVEAIRNWKHSPWKKPTIATGDHFFKLEDSTDPRDQGRCKELYRLSDIWFQQLLERHPDMAVASKNVPDDQNGFRKWLDFTERFKKPGSHREYSPLEFPKELSDYLYKKTGWNPEATRTWLNSQKSLLDEIRAIGLMPDQSNHGIDIECVSMKNATVTKSSADALLMDARLAAEDGDVRRALDSVRAANGIADHLDQVETPSLYAETVSTLIRLSVLDRAFSEIMPALPAGKIDVATWEAALHPMVSSPAEFSRLLKGEWSVGMKRFILPILADAGDPRNPPDPEDFIDVYTEMFRRHINANPSHDSRKLLSFSTPPSPSATELSPESRSLYPTGMLDSRPWRTGWVRVQAISGMFQAAFAIMKGQPIPADPITCLPYGWNPATRELSAPSHEIFKGTKPINVPKL